MIKFNSNIKLDNGAIIKYCILSILSISTERISITLDGFVNKDYADKALAYLDALKEQEDLIKEFKELDAQLEHPEEVRLKLIELQDIINNKADEIASMTKYDNIVVCHKTYNIDYTDNVTEDYIMTELQKIDELKNIARDIEYTIENDETMEVTE